uniref:Starch-binding domain-like protein n=1 Tax=Tetraselmis sp. GSL018 TaxID=582737 RepID=A0A061QPX2_9CHLO|mmetsp:Transcript_40967/g.97329  ORF Transcript_40967/g.97329 Transcript_40967/m.97329 type:complete len:388 (-) Transcript_40967:120-1283(-)
MFSLRGNCIEPFRSCPAERSGNRTDPGTLQMMTRLHQPRNRVKLAAAQWFAELRDQTVKVLFHLPYRCSFGQSLALVGSPEPLGSWDVSKCVQMTWSEGDIWRGEIELDPGSFANHLEYKYVVRNHDGTVITWKPGENIRLEIPREQAKIQEVVVGDAWDGETQSIELIEGADRQESAAEPIAESQAVSAAAAADVPEPLAGKSHPARLGDQGVVGHQAEQIRERADDVSSQLSECLKSASTEEAITECLTLASRLPDRSAATEDSTRGAAAGVREKYQELLAALEGMYSEDLACYIVESVSDQALVDLDDALTRSHELQERLGDPAAPEVLAADRMVAAAAKRAVDMTRALHATRNAALLSLSGRTADRDAERDPGSGGSQVRGDD